MKKTPTFKEALLLLIIGILIGTVFTFGMQHWNKEVTQEECQKIETQFLGHEQLYDTWKLQKRKRDMAIDCANGQRYLIDQACVDVTVREKLQAISYMEDITIFLHPNQNDKIVSMSTNNETILSFPEGMGDLTTEATGFLIFGLFMYSVALVGLYYIIRFQVKKKRKR